RVASRRNRLEASGHAGGNARRPAGLAPGFQSSYRRDRPPNGSLERSWKLTVHRRNVAILPTDEVRPKQGREPREKNTSDVHPGSTVRGRRRMGDAFICPAVERHLSGASRVVLARRDRVRKRDWHQGGADAQGLG